MSTSLTATRSSSRPYRGAGAARSVYLRIDEEVARVIDRGARDLGESPSAFLGRVLQSVFPGLCSEIECTRRVR